jgi:hypothetical protein
MGLWVKEKTKKIIGQSNARQSRQGNGEGLPLLCPIVLAGLFSGGVKGRHFCRPVGRLSLFGIGLR